VEIPALLLYAALRTQDLALQREARQLLRKHARRKQLVNWPGAIVPYLLGKISTEELQAAAHWPSAPAVLLERHHCQVSFYVGVRGLLDLDESAFRAAMRECAASWYGFLEQEYYLATWEVENDFPDIPSDHPPIGWR
jgi:lipoprotein NlpI